MMQQQHIFVFFISLWLGLAASNLLAQEEVVIIDSIPAKTQYYGLRIGVDIAKPLRTLLDDDYSGFEITGDFRIKDRYYLAAEIGNENRITDLPNINSTSTGSYIKAGFNYNAYDNWLGMNNLIYAGVRGGFSTFSQDLNSYTIYTTTDLFEDDTRTDSRSFSGLSASWLEFQLGVQVELFSNIYLGANVQIKRSITNTEPDGFENLFIPGFGKTTDGSSFGVGYSYTLSYLIPFFKR
ncbi:MAG: hypothetical protein ACI828_002607 [Flavobacteriales bacterium]|jgi:hypothetical protein